MFEFLFCSRNQNLVLHSMDMNMQYDKYDINSEE